MNFHTCSRYLCGLFAAAFAHAHAHAQDATIQHIHASVHDTIVNADAVPGLKSEEFTRLNDGIMQRWGTLSTTGALVVTAADHEVRPYFVAIQAIVEHVLSSELNKGIVSLAGIIHTPMPATPLCTEGEVSSGLVDPSIAQDPLRIFTVKSRATIVRDYLYQGGDLYIAYPKDGLGKRSEAQQKIYKQELQNYPEHLFDVPLECHEIDPDVIGATYFFTTNDGKSYVFAIKMTQANDPKEVGNFGLWLGSQDHPAIQERLSKVMPFLEANGFHGVTR